MDTGDTFARVYQVSLTVLKFLAAIAVTLALWVVGAVKACLPASIIGHKSIANQVVLVTGAGSGLGRLLAIRFAKIGARLVLWDINQQWLDETVKLIRDMDDEYEVHSYVCDLSNREEVYKKAQQVTEEVGVVDILVNNAGIVVGKKLLDCPDDMMVKTMEINCMSHFWTTKAFLPAMLERNFGHIVSVASGAGIVAVPGLADYCASKFGAVGFMEALGLELYKEGKTGVETTTVCPFYINTGMFDGVISKYVPVLEPDFVVDRIMDGVLTNQKILYIPRILYFLLALKGANIFLHKVKDHTGILNIEAAIYLADFMGMFESMDTFKGRKNPALQQN